ncbi:histidine phosphatase family protein [Roseovarius sp. ZX-A-9]|uniref:histidine phosphatase family protein n=1 Tax=Roseovarius sp. ZX-A-9 TaxID=3014783 RepID=UPI00232B7996|nr:histidine phosphatase family protein [Roseovarius sp. ZX-A-9]
MSRIYWVRHGPTHAKSMVGWSDLPADLSDTAQLARLDAYLPRDALVISSDLIRARATADAIQQSRSRLPDDADLREIHFGAWELQDFDSVDDSAHLRRFWEEPGDISPPGGESWHAVSARVSGAVARLRAAHPGRDIIAVAHFGAILSQVQQALQIDAYAALGHHIDNLSVTVLQAHGPRWRAETINHLP